MGVVHILRGIAKTGAVRRIQQVASINHGTRAVLSLLVRIGMQLAHTCRIKENDFISQLFRGEHSSQQPGHYALESQRVAGPTTTLRPRNFCPSHGFPCLSGR